MKRKKTSPYLIILLGFLVLILTGTLLLELPFATTNNISFVDALFTSTSAVCVTGLTTIDIASSFTVFGKIVIALLIQLGGLGVVTLGAFIMIAIGAKIGIKERVLLKEALNQNTLQGLVVLVKKILITTLIIEGIGAILNFIVFYNDFDFFEALGQSIFHAISSFNNAGIVIVDTSANSLINYSDNIILNFSTTSLIIIGGIGYIVIFDILNLRKTKKLNIHSKIVLWTTFFLLVIPTIFIKLDNNVTWLEAFFQSVTCRTAGFSTVDMANFTVATVMLSICLMFIGTSPVSTGGGIKTTTFYTMIKSIISFAKGKACVTFNRKISDKSVLRAFLMTVLAISYIFFIVFLLTMVEKDMSVLELTFETVSAFATVGLSLGITTKLAALSKVLLCLTMFFGRVGLLSFVSLWNSRWNTESDESIDFIEEKIIIG